MRNEREQFVNFVLSQKHENMFFNRNNRELREEDEYHSSSNNFAYPVEERNNNELLLESEKKRAFFNAIHGKTLDQIMDDLAAWVNQQIFHRHTNANNRTLLLQQKIYALKSELQEKQQALVTTDAIEERYKAELDEFERSMESLNDEFTSLVTHLGEAHKNLISNRISEAEEELTKLVDMYHNVFNKKYGDEQEFKLALEKRREFVDELINDNNERLKVVQEKLKQFYLIGGSRLSANFLSSIGLLSAIAAGYYFSAFSNTDSFTNQNWLFFGLSNLFNYLFLYVDEFGPLNAVKGMLINFTMLLALISVFIWVVQYTLQKITNDQSDIEFGINSEKKKSTFFRLQISSKSALSFWLQLLPWVFIAGLILIMLTVGQYIGAEKDQISELEKRLSGQIIGTTITLICTAIFYLYMTKVVEQRKQNDSLDSGKTIAKSKKNRELLFLVPGVNILIGIIIINQVLGTHIPHSNIIFSVLCFILLLNLTAFTLSYGIKQKGLFRSSNELESKIKYLTNLRIALSGSKPIRLWIRESYAFDKTFLAIRKDLHDLSRIKNTSLNQLKNPKKYFGFWDRTDSISLYSAERFSEMNKSSKREAQFFLRNFPELSYKIAKVRNDMNAIKRDIDMTQVRLRELHEGHSDYQNKLKDEIRGLKSRITELQKTIINIQDSTDRFIQTMEEEKRTFELHLMQGFELGVWTKNQLIENSIKEHTA